MLHVKALKCIIKQEFSVLNKSQLGLNSHLSTRSHTQTCPGVSFMALIPFHSVVEIIILQ